MIWILGQSHVCIGVCIPVWCVCHCYTVTNRNCCTDLIIQLQPLGPFKVLCVIKAGINSRLWPSLLMTNYWQLFWRMASLHPVFSFILFSQLAPTQARRSRLHWHRNALSQMCLEMNLLSGWSFCTHACAPKGLSYRILEQIPAQGHTFYLCGLFNSAAEGGWMQGSAHDRAKTLQSNRTPKFLKSHYVITHWLCSVCVCSWRWIIDLWQVMRAHINEGDLSLPPPSISPLLLPLHSHSCSPFCCNFPMTANLLTKSNPCGELPRVSLSGITSTDGKNDCQLICNWTVCRSSRNSLRPFSSWAFWCGLLMVNTVHHKSKLRTAPVLTVADVPLNVLWVYWV